MEPSDCATMNIILEACLSFCAIEFSLTARAIGRCRDLGADVHAPHMPAGGMLVEALQLLLDHVKLFKMFADR